MLRNTENEWGWVSIALHWSMAVLLFSQIALGKYAEALSLSPQKLNLMMWHKSLGISLLFLVLVRLTWNISHKRPVTTALNRPFMKLAARASHAILYLLMLSIPISGWLMNSAKNVPFSLFRRFPWPSLIEANESLGHDLETIHNGLVWVLLVAILLHFSAALWHHFRLRDDVLVKMVGGRRD